MFDRAEELGREGHVDLAIITTKSYDTQQVVRTVDFRALVAPGGGVLTLQNGMSCAKPLLLQHLQQLKTSSGFGSTQRSSMISDDHVHKCHHKRPKEDIVVMDGVTDMGARIPSPGVVQYTGLGLTTIEHADDVVAPSVASLFRKVHIILPWTLFVPSSALLLCAQHLCSCSHYRQAFGQTCTATYKARNGSNSSSTRPSTHSQPSLEFQTARY